jgi:hypothetical protein
MRRGRRRIGAVVLAASVLASCDLPPMISDTGYRGTWRRGNDRNVSIVAITESSGRWYFRWTKWSSDGRLAVHCDWDGRCEELVDGKRVATYTITTRFDADSGKLWTDTVEEWLVPARPPRRYTEVMEIRNGGLTLLNVTTDRDGERFEGLTGPQRSFTKIANSVADPPRSLRP